MTRYFCTSTECPICKLKSQEREGIVSVSLEVCVPEEYSPREDSTLVFKCGDCNAAVPIKGPHDFYEVTELPGGAIIGFIPVDSTSTSD